jgi:hypothetical protein
VPLEYLDDPERIELRGRATPGPKRCAGLVAMRWQCRGDPRGARDRAADKVPADGNVNWSN